MSPPAHRTLGLSGVGDGDAGDELDVGEGAAVGHGLTVADGDTLGGWLAVWPEAWLHAASITTAKAPSNLMPWITGANRDR
jgi:hypothetical protein